MNNNVSIPEERKIRLSRSYLFLFLFFLFLLYPTALFPGGIRFGIALLSVLFILTSVLSKNAKLDLGYYLFLLCSLSVLVSVTISAGYIFVNDIVEVARPIFYLSTVLFCRSYSGALDLKLFSRFLMLFIFIEFLFVFLQRLDVSNFVQFVELIWSLEGNWKYRNTGTFSNPNILGGFLVFSWLGYVFFNRDGVLSELLLTSVVLFSIVLSGSKTSIVLLVSAIYIVFFLKYSFVRFSFLSVAVVPIVLMAAYLWVTKNAVDNAYIIQLLNVFEPGGGLESVKSYSDRQSIWNEVVRNYDDEGLVSVLFGYGPDKDGFLRSVDNEYLGVYYRYGVVGALALYCPILFFVVRLYACRKLSSEVSSVYYAVLSTLVMLFIAGFVMESFSSWVYSFVFYVYIGLGLAKIDSIKENRAAD